MLVCVHKYVACGAVHVFATALTALFSNLTVEAEAAVQVLNDETETETEVPAALQALGNM
jgi:hypothetical protein